ncbi:MAG TPA: hypothetical protein PKA13_13570 [Geminicoccaceae bacterium]|nr:hypothetical protein [Geminicoccus sp.]HMU50799.1 hypothetical protein [Geminicoccaceae bacterium]
MLDLRLTRHAEVRMRQRGFRKADVDLVLSVATRVADDAFFLTDRDVAREIERRKHEIQQLERLRGSKIIIDADSLITLYHTTPKVLDKLSGTSARRRRIVVGRL